jgi:hypothetical protein
VGIQHPPQKIKNVPDFSGIQKGDSPGGLALMYFAPR